jgi:hypothetical protein
MIRRALCALAAALLVGCANASHVDWAPHYSCFPACDQDGVLPCPWKSDGCDGACSEECGFTQLADEPLQAPTGPTVHSGMTYDCTGCKVTCGTPTGCPAGFVFHACVENDQSRCASQTPKACRSVAGLADCAGCCLKSTDSAASAATTTRAVTATPAPAAASTPSSSAPKNTTHFVTLTFTMPYSKVRSVLCLYTVKEPTMV